MFLPSISASDAITPPGPRVASNAPVPRRGAPSSLDVLLTVRPDPLRAMAPRVASVQVPLPRKAREGPLDSPFFTIGAARAAHVSGPKCARSSTSRPARPATKSVRSSGRYVEAESWTRGRGTHEKERSTNPLEVEAGRKEPVETVEIGAC